MRKILFILSFVFIIIFYESIIFASYNNNEALEEEIQPYIEQSFENRNKVWNKFLAGQYSSIYKIENELKNFVVNPLLKSDIKMFETMIKEPMSFEEISNVSIQDISIIENKREVVILDTTVIWTVLDYREVYKEKVKYIIKMKKNKNKWFLSDYEIKK